MGLLSETMTSVCHMYNIDCRELLEFHEQAAGEVLRGGFLLGSV